MEEENEDLGYQWLTNRFIAEPLSSRRLLRYDYSYWNINLGR